MTKWKASYVCKEWTDTDIDGKPSDDEVVRNAKKLAEDVDDKKMLEGFAVVAGVGVGVVALSFMAIYVFNKF
tara:strand:+ start:367 stop:582 length:216 start_codon:yes stop_codon:yes gene_type:complete